MSFIVHLLASCFHFSSPEPKAHKVSLKDGHAPASVRRRPQFQRNRLANQSQTSCGASLE